MTVLDKGAIDKYRDISETLAEPALIAKLRALFDRRYTSVELLNWVHRKLKWDDGEIKRHNHPLEILDYGRGRCGEFSILFTAVCVAHGYRARLILDMSDHVWTEIWDPTMQRWVHIDPSERRVDDPLMYEREWKKTLSKVYALENGRMEEVTESYRMLGSANRGADKKGRCSP
jgi:transglutaminase-like putative cysteine protease